MRPTRVRSLRSTSTATADLPSRRPRQRGSASMWIELVIKSSCHARVVELRHLRLQAQKSDGVVLPLYSLPPIAFCS